MPKRRVSGLALGQVDVFKLTREAARDLGDLPGPCTDTTEPAPTEESKKSRTALRLTLAPTLCARSIAELIINNSRVKAMRNVEWFTGLTRRERLAVCRRYLPA